MKPLSDLTADQISKIKLISFDSDGVLVKKGTDIKQDTNGFYSQQVNLLSPSVIEKLNKLKTRFDIVINSGRNSLYLTDLYREILWDKVTLISEIGVFLTGQGFMVQTQPLDSYELNTINNIRRELSKLIGNPRVKGFEPKQFLTTLHCATEVPEVNEIVKKNDPENKFYCWWNLEAYDINSQKFTKGNALKKLLEIKKINPETVLTVGNGINDNDPITSQFLNISTDPANLVTDDFAVEGEENGGEKILDHLLSLF